VQGRGWEQGRNHVRELSRHQELQWAQKTSLGSQVPLMAAEGACRVMAASRGGWWPTFRVVRGFLETCGILVASGRSLAWLLLSRDCQ